VSLSIGSQYTSVATAAVFSEFTLKFMVLFRLGQSSVLVQGQYEGLKCLWVKFKHRRYTGPVPCRSRHGQGFQGLAGSCWAVETPCALAEIITTVHV
jgi:hypothetical protein